MRVSDSDANAALEAAWASGIRYFDTSPWYGIGVSEHRVGRFLRDKPKGDYILSTKVGRLLRRWPSRFGPRVNRGPTVDPLDFEIRFDYSYEGIMRSYEDSLQRLGLPEVDILFVHDLDRDFHSAERKYSAYLSQLITGGFDALRDLRASGQVRAIGAGVNVRGVISEFLDYFDPDVFLVAGPYTLVQHAILDGELQRAHEAGVSVVIGAAFADGILATGVVNRSRESLGSVRADVLDRVRRIEEICDRSGVPLSAVALQFPASHPAVASVLFGGVNASQVQQAIKSFDTAIPLEVWAELKSERLLPENAPVPT